ncbi:MAG: sensor histidine kinase, partial [Nitrospinota bacterium]|nr:sensor histidine kinase [Nitrospinota bacterium]
MNRRNIPGLAALGLGLVALAWGLASLQALFATERGEALAELEARRKALDFYAQKTLDMKLNQALERELKRIRDAAEDPLLPDDGLLLARAGLQVLPRPIIYRAGEEKPATELYQSLLVGRTSGLDDEPGSPWARRLELFSAFRVALSKRDTPKIERTFREILLLKAMFKLSAAREIPFTLALLEDFVENGSPDQDLMRAMLRDSLPAGPGREKIMGLQRALLTSREKFTRPDFDFLAGRIIALSEKSGVEHSNFSSQAQAAPTPSPAEPWPSGAPPMLVDSRWYVKDIDGDPHGVAVDLPLLLAAVADGMKELGLLAPEDSVALEGRLDHEQPAALMPVAVRLAKWDSALAAIARRYRLKTGLVFTTGFSAMAILALIAVAQRRKERFLAMKSDFVAAVS